MRFLRRIEGVILFYKMRSYEIQKSLNIKPLFLRIERSQLRWFGHVSRMPQKTPQTSFIAKSNGKRTVGQPKNQRWSRGHKARGQGQGHKKNPRPRPGQPFRGQTLSRPWKECSRSRPRSKDTGSRCSQKKGLHKIFQAISKKNGLLTTFLVELQKTRSSTKFFKRSTKF